MTARAIWRSEQPSYEQPIWSSQRPPVAPTFALESLDAATPSALAFTRATACSGTDYQGNIFQALSGEMTRQGLRRVQNHIAKSDNNADTISKDAGTSVTSTTVTLGSANASYWYKTSATSGDSGSKWLCSFYISCSVDRQIGLRAARAADGTNDTEAVLAVTATPQLVTLPLTLTGAGTLQVGIENRSAVVAGLTDTSTSGVFTITGVQFELARPGQTAASERVSTGVLASPYHGAFVDGVRYFDTDEHGAKITGTGAGYDRDGTGAWVRSSSVAPIEVGIPVIPAQTNRITYSSALASWSATGSPTVTAGYDAQVGVFTRLDGLGAAGVADVYLASSGFTGSARTEIALMLKAGGTGTLRIRNPQGLAYGQWDLDRSLLSTTRHELVNRFHPAVTITTEFTATAGGASGVQICRGDAGSHDNVSVSWVTQVEAERCYRPIYSAALTTVTNADAPSFTWTGFASNNEGTLVMSFVRKAPLAPAATYLSGPLFVFKSAGSTAVHSFDGTNLLSFGDDAEGGESHVATAWQIGVGRTGYRDGVEKFVNGSYDGAFASGTITFGGPMLLKSLPIYDYALTAEQLQGVSA